MPLSTFFVRSVLARTSELPNAPPNAASAAFCAKCASPVQEMRSPRSIRIDPKPAAPWYRIVACVVGDEETGSFPMPGCGLRSDARTGNRSRAGFDSGGIAARAQRDVPSLVQLSSTPHGPRVSCTRWCTTPPRAPSRPLPAPHRRAAAGPGSRRRGRRSSSVSPGRPP